MRMSSTYLALQLPVYLISTMPDHRSTQQRIHIQELEGQAEDLKGEAMRLARERDDARVEIRLEGI